MTTNKTRTTSKARTPNKTQSTSRSAKPKTSKPPKANRRTELLQTAVAVIATDGVRGLRVEKLAAEAGVSTALIYYHFTDRQHLVDAALEHICSRAESYTDPALDAPDPRARVEQMLLLELQDDESVRTTSIAWGELRASAVFNEALREPLRAATESWNDDIAALLAVCPHRSTFDPSASAGRLTALVEGLSERWHSGSLSLPQAQALLRGAVANELHGD